MKNCQSTLVKQFLNCSQNQFTGKLEIAASTQTWSFFFCLGRLVWATGGLHSNRRFRRLWHQFCPGVSVTGIKLRDEDFVVCYNYQVMAVLAIREKLTPQQKSEMVMETLSEVIFDLFQAESKEPLTYTRDTQGAIDTSLTMMSALVRPEQVFPLVQLLWSDWQKSDLVDYSPNMVPLLKDVKHLQQVTSPKTYKNLVKAIDGKHTLRDLAVSFKQDLRRLTLYLIPYVRKGLIDLRWLPDTQKPEQVVGVAAVSPTKARKKTPRARNQIPAVSSKKPLIVCVDDSPQVGHHLQSILEKAGYRFMGVQDSIRALPTAIETKPDLIFLDLVMPIANGYEICAQIRRVSWLKETPIIILTGNDSMVDRVRAKMVGSSDFLAKPIEPEKVLAVVRKYLEVTSPLPADAFTGRRLEVQPS